MRCGACRSAFFLLLAAFAAAAGIERTAADSSAAATSSTKTNLPPWLLRRVIDLAQTRLFDDAGPTAYAVCLILHKLCGGWNQAIALAVEHFGLVETVETKKNLQNLRKNWWWQVLNQNQQDEFNAAVKNLKNQT